LTYIELFGHAGEDVKEEEGILVVRALEIVLGMVRRGGSGGGRASSGRLVRHALLEISYGFLKMFCELT
jgi:hypothetical protein